MKASITPPSPPLVVVTGAGRGIGHETALSLVTDHGAEVIAVSRNVDVWRGTQVAVTPIAADLASEVGRALVIRAIGERPLFGLVNNAGTLLKRGMGDWTSFDLEHLFGLNAVSPLLLTQSLLPALQRSEVAHVVNISSMGGFQGSAKFPGLVGYSASKAALACITECMAEELRSTRVRCNCLCLGAADTAMLREAFPGYTAQVSAQEMGRYIASFLFQAHNLLNGKVIPVSLSTP